jgi:hypothetical protein
VACDFLSVLCDDSLSNFKIQMIEHAKGIHGITVIDCLPLVHVELLLSNYVPLANLLRFSLLSAFIVIVVLRIPINSLLGQVP